jgi:hypothetical protein
MPHVLLLFQLFGTVLTQVGLIYALIPTGRVEDLQWRRRKSPFRLMLQSPEIRWQNANLWSQ